MKRFIPVAAPALVGNEKKYVEDCLDSTWISSTGKYIEQFELAFANFCGVKYALSCANGTVALHLALMGLGIGPGDEVIVPTLTYVATANAVMYCGATPVFIDSEPETWNLNPSLLPALITHRTKAIIVVHLYGHPVDMDAVSRIASQYGLFIIEDAAEAHGAEYQGKRAGSLADVATFSFYGNKIITTGEGGMLTTNNSELALKIHQLKGQGMDPVRRYWFPMVGYNYRMTNIQAAIGLAQLEKIDWQIERRREIHQRYTSFLKSIPSISIQPEQKFVKSVFWLTSIVFGDDWPFSRDESIVALAQKGVETRPFFYPMHILPMYIPFAQKNRFPVADHVSSRGINLPSSALLPDDDIEYICNCLATLNSGNKS